MAWNPLAGTYDKIYCDGFDNYQEGLDRWTIGQEFHTAGQPDTSIDYSRHSFGRGAFINGRSAMIELSRPSSAIIVEGAFNYRSVFNFGIQEISFLKLDVATWGHCALRLSQSRHPYFTNYDSGTPLAGPISGPEHVVEIGRWYWFSLYASIHASAGEMVLWVNGDEWLRAEGLNIRHPSASAAICDCVQLSGQFGTSWFVDDIVIQDGTTGKFMGDMIVLGKRPAAPGYINQFTPVGAATGWECTKEVNPDEDTTHVASAVLGERDSYLLDKITEVPDTSIVLSVQQTFRHRKDEPGPRSVTAFTRVATDEFLGEERFPSETAYRTSIEGPQLTQPDGVSAWGTVAQFNALDVEIGQEVGDGLGES